MRAFDENAFRTELYQARQEQNFDQIKKLAYHFVISRLNPLDIYEKLGFLISLHANLFGGSHEKIARDLKTHTKSDNLENHCRYILQAMIESTPDEDGDKSDPSKWYYGQVFRIEKSLSELNSHALRVGTGHIAPPTLQ